MEWRHRELWPCTERVTAAAGQKRGQMGGLPSPRSFGAQDQGWWLGQQLRWHGPGEGSG